MNQYPTDRQYAKTHEWVKIENGVATVGISDFAQSELGDIVYVELPDIDAEFESEAEIAVVESVKAASDIYAPVAGKVIEINEELDDDPELVNQDAYDKGWFIKLEVDSNVSTEGLLTAEEYQKLCESDSD